MIPEIPEEPKKKYFRVQKSGRHKFHIAKRKIKTGNFRSLCGMMFAGDRVPAVSITTYIGFECRRCQRAAAILRYDWLYGRVRVVRIRRTGPS